MPSDVPTEVKFDIGHVLFIDIVGYSKLLINEQSEQIQTLRKIVRGTEQFRLAEAEGKLLRLPTGDGGALVFRNSPEAPVLCALEIGKELKKHSELRVRMGIHSGPVSEIADLNEQANIAGAGINVAQRVMDCGDGGHILLSKHVADDLAQYGHWRPYLRDLGEWEVKHGFRLQLASLCKDGIGNPAVPEKLRRGARWQRKSATVRAIKPAGLPRPLLLGGLSLAVLGIALASFVFLRGRVSAPPPSGVSNPISEKSIAVLPFENLSDDKQNAYFSDGVQDEILNGLSKVADLKVISRTSVMQYRSQTGRNLREIAKALGVAHIVEGSVQRSGNRVRVSAQLINAQTDMHLWGQHYDRDLADVFALESELAEKIVGQLKATLSPEEKAAIEDQPTKDLVAHDLYVRAKDLIDGISVRAQGKDDLFQAVGLLDRAVARDPAFLRAYCALARAHDSLYFYGDDHTAGRLDLARKAVDAALKLRPDSGEAHLALAQHLLLGYRDYDGARREISIAQPKLPNDPQVFMLA